MLANLMGDDMFEKAREAFFGIVKKSPEPSVAPTEVPTEPQDETPAEEDTNPVN
jgi:hypothetical protein